MDLWKRLILAVSFVVGTVALMSCSYPPETERTSYEPEQALYHYRTSWLYHCIGVAALTELPRVDATRYTIDPSAVPDFSIVMEVLGPGSPGGLNTIAIATHMERAIDCEKFLVIFIEAEQPDAVDILPVENWRAVAGEEAVNALDQLQTECEAQSRRDAIMKFGSPRVRSPEGDVQVVSDTSDICGIVTLSHVYALRVSGPDGDMIISNVLGRIYFEDL